MRSKTRKMCRAGLICFAISLFVCGLTLIIVNNELKAENVPNTSEEDLVESQTVLHSKDRPRLTKRGNVAVKFSPESIINTSVLDKEDNAFPLNESQKNVTKQRQHRIDNASQLLDKPGLIYKMMKDKNVDKDGDEHDVSRKRDSGNTTVGPFLHSTTFASFKRKIHNSQKTVSSSSKKTQDGLENQSRSFLDKLFCGNQTELHMRKSGDESCCVVQSEAANCSHCGLTNIPDDLPSNIVCLNLAYNRLTSTSLKVSVFAKYPELRALRLDSNNISSLPLGGFENLEKLKYLNLYNNGIKVDAHFPSADVFRPLSATLTHLIINRNNDNPKSGALSYPDQSLSVLTQLEVLFIDGLKDQDFKDGMSALKKLVSLTMAGYFEGYCNMLSISNETFRYLPSLQHLNLSDCNLFGLRIDDDAFTLLTELEVLDVSNNFQLGIEAIGNFMYGLRNNKNFRYLRMQRILPRFSVCVVVYNYTLRHFRNSGLEVIDAMDNGIEMIQRGALKMLPPTLHTVNFKNNKIMFGAYWRDMASLHNLRYLYLDGYRRPADFPFFFPSRNLSCNEEGNLSSEGPEDDSLDMDHNDSSYAVEQKPGSTACRRRNKFVLQLPPNLRNLSMHSNSLQYTVRKLCVNSSNNLESVDLSGNIFHSLIGPVDGLHKLKYIDLSSSFVQHISGGFFDTFKSLEYLNLYQNLLGNQLYYDFTSSIFDNLHNLKYLNISFNNLFRLNVQAFKDLDNLEILDVSINRLSHLYFNIHHMKKLRFLDLHKNDFRTIPPKIRNDISALLLNNVSVKIDMRQNPISCECVNLPFLEWVVKTKVFGENYTLYYCEIGKVEIEMVQGYDEIVDRLRLQCADNVGLFIGVIGGTVILLSVMTGFLIHRFRWTLRYWYHAAKLKVTTRPSTNTEEFEYDVFISYAHTDVEFVAGELQEELSSRRQLRLLIHGETFQAGRHIADNIYMAVTQSRKTLVVVTRNMLKSHWCTYELQMARMESIGTGRDVLMFMFLEDVPVSEMSTDVVTYIKTSTYTSYPSCPSRRKKFWDKLAKDIKA